MALKLSELKRSRKEILESIAKLESQLHYLEGLISALSNHCVSKNENPVESGAFQGAVRDFFARNDNVPMKRALVLQYVMSKIPGIDVDTARNKFTYMKRQGIVAADANKKYVWTNKIDGIFTRASWDPDLDFDPADESDEGTSDVAADAAADAEVDRYIEEEIERRKGK